VSLTLVTGPVRSGKSRHAESLLRGRDRVLYLATGRTADDTDAEWSERVRQHRARRPTRWRTVETADVVDALTSAASDEDAVLLDCLGTWLTAVVDAAGWHDLALARSVVEHRCRALLDALTSIRADIVVVTNEVGWSLVPTTTSGRFFQDELGRLNAAVAAASEHVHLVVAGRVLDLSSAPVVSDRAPGFDPSEASSPDGRACDA
jgi:adenosylcobinamide kinase/adenosylcobinamide-phosphate guanylyltransferase